MRIWLWAGMVAAALTLFDGTAYAQRTQNIVPGRQVSGDLRNNDDTLPSGEFVDTYVFQGRAGQRVVVSMQSNAFDTYIIFVGPNGFQTDNDDDPSGGTVNSRVDAVLPADGAYAVRATSYAPGSVGAYTLAVLDGSNAPQATASLDNTNGAPLLPNEPRDGVLQASDGQLQSGEYVDSYRFLGYAGQRVVIDMQSNQLDPYLIVRAPSGEQFDNDDVAPGNTNAQLQMTLAEDGEYSVHATTFQPGETGSYRVTVSSSDSGGREVAAAAGEASGGLRANRPASGRLEPGDATLDSGEFADLYTFSGQRGQRITIDMQSTEIDSYLAILTPSGEVQNNDDAEPGNVNSRLQLTLPESGEYSIVATSYRPGEVGSYTIQIATGGSTTPQPVAGEGARVHAVMVGISDYAGYAGNLPYTADDAINLARTLGEQQLLSSDSVVLTDAQATRANVRAAFMRVAANAGPNDLFLFFYSGHGSQTADQPGSTEADRREESIVLVDGLVTDDEMAQWFGAVRARVALIALDSCFSGGFARDVVSRPGIMGLFSSEEDLTSAVAGKFQAGGYLSHFLRTGLGGEADTNQNGVITAGELSTYLWTKFATEVEDVRASTREQQQNYQRLVVDRGGVKIDDMVLSLSR